MAVRIKFDSANNVIPPTFVLATRSCRKLGVIPAYNVKFRDPLSSFSELTFKVNKFDGKKEFALWDKIKDFKLVWCQDWDIWFEISVSIDQSNELVKNISAKALGESELSQIKIYDVEINTENDISRDDYQVTKLYDSTNPKASLLHRILEKAPHYKVSYVSDSIKNLQRTFTFSDTTIFDAFQTISEEIHCLFVIDSGSNEFDKARREISVWDLESYCFDCKKRDEFIDSCPHCGGKNVTHGYGEDTNIFISTEALADNITYSTDVGSVKNCFRLTAGDDLMTATIRNCNPNGSNYIWYISDETKEDMSEALVKKLSSYDFEYDKQINGYSLSSDKQEIIDYNNKIVEVYSKYTEDPLSKIENIKGFSSLMSTYYNVIDCQLLLESSLMPTVEISSPKAEDELAKLTQANLSPVSVTNLTSLSKATANSAVLAMAKVIVDSRFKVEIVSSEFEDNIWTGIFSVTNYSDEDDNATMSEDKKVSVTINDDYENFVRQKIDKALSNGSDDVTSITGLFKLGSNQFESEIKKYSLSRLNAFLDSCQGCIDILIEQGVASDEDSDVYKQLYEPYYAKLGLLQNEVKLRESDISIVENLLQLIENERTSVQNALDFQEYLGEDLWLEFVGYRREDTYQNDNYISDGLTNAELISNALEFIEVAKKEIFKSATLQHSISATLKNLLVMKEFQPLVNSFEKGNWIRCKIDGEVYRLRLLEYEIDCDDLQNLPVVFSDVERISTGMSDVESILSQASAMATSYGAIQRQAQQGDNAQGTIDEWLNEGLNSALVQIKNNDTEDMIITGNGLLGRSYSDIDGEYSPEQLRITHNIMAYTTDNWKTVSSALGKHNYKYWNGNDFVAATDYGLSAKFVTAGYISGSQIVGGEILSTNYIPNQKGAYIDLINGDFDLAGGKIKYNKNDNTVLLNGVTIKWESSNAPEITNIPNLSTKIEALNEADEKIITGLGFQETEITGEYVISPYIGGGYLHITKEDGDLGVIIDPNNLTNSGYVFRVYNSDATCVGIDSDGNAVFQGDISGSTFKSDSGNFEIHEDGIITSKGLTVENEISTKTLIVDTISNQEYQKTLTDSVTMYVDSINGDDTETTDDDGVISKKCKNGAVFKTLQGAINSIPKFMNGKYVYIELKTNIVENVEVRYFSGGMIFVYLAGHKIYGAINNYSNYHIRYYGGTLDSEGTSSPAGEIHPSKCFSEVTQKASLIFNGCNNARIQNLKIYGADDTTISTKIGVSSQYQASVLASDIEFANVDIGFQAIGCGLIHSVSSSGIAKENGFLATTGGVISLSDNEQVGGSTKNYASGNGGEIRLNSATFSSGETSTSTETASTEKVAKSVLYTSSKGNSIRTMESGSSSWRTDNSPKIGTWKRTYGDHTAWWFFGDAFDNISNKEIDKVEIIFTRINGGYSEPVKHNFYVHGYKSQPNSANNVVKGADVIGTASVKPNTTETITLNKTNNSDLISKIKSAKGICAMDDNASPGYSVLSGTMKVRFYYSE